MVDGSQPSGARPEHAGSPVWSSQRKLLGNLVPAAILAPLVAIGVWKIALDARDRGDLIGTGLLLLALSVPVGWIAINLFALYDNQKMRSEMVRRFRAEGHAANLPAFFVGMASPSHFSVVDPYEDVGLAVLHAESIEFYGDRLRLSLERHHVTGIRLKPNLFTFLGLGCWVVVEGKIGDLTVQMKLWLRERQTLLANLRISKVFRDRLRTWLNTGE